MQELQGQNLIEVCKDIFLETVLEFSILESKGVITWIRRQNKAIWRNVMWYMSFTGWVTMAEQEERVGVREHCTPSILPLPYPQ